MAVNLKWKRQKEERNRKITIEISRRERVELKVEEP
jgi:hypothetical protein